MPALLTPEQQSTLAERIRRREAPAEEEFVPVFANRIALLARTRTRDSEVSRDLTQDVMLAVVHALRNGHLREAERLTAFVYGTARNVINNHLRARGRLPREEGIDAASHLASLPDHLENTGRAVSVRQAFASLDSTNRKILLLTLMEGLKPGEIAGRLGLTSEVVRARKSRALRAAIARVKTG
jgi:RNA polymerase sigma-70 factor (ECF subfamily)